MKIVIGDEDRIKSWELLIDEVDKTDIPIEVVQVVNLEFHVNVDGEGVQDIDLKKMREHGYKNSELEVIMEEIMREHKDNIKSVSFYLNVKYIAEAIEKHTNVLLGGVN